MLNGNLQLPVDCLGSQSKTLEFILLFLLPDPRNTLKLRIDNKGISLTVGQDSTILNWDLVRWQGLLVPLGSRRLVCEQLNWVHRWTHRDFVSLEVLVELLFNHDVPELFVEWPGVGDEGRWHQNVTHNDLNLFVKDNNWLCPSFILTAQGFDQSLSQIKSPSTSLGLVNGSLFFVLGLLELLVKLGKFSVQLSHYLLHFIELDCGDFQLFLCIFQLLT